MATPNPVTLLNEAGQSNWLLICEHASFRVPDNLKQLGLEKKFLKQHIGYDIGSYAMTLRLSQQLDATAIICNYSRLVIDCNRALTAEDCIPTVSDGIIIPGNQQLSKKDKEQRITGIYQPFHQVVTQTIINKLIHNPQLKIINIHSFTPMLSEEGVPRPWEIGFIYRQPSPTQQVITYLRSQTQAVVGDNEPYNGFTHPGYTLPVHADAQGIPGILVEFRQDLINNEKGQAFWSEIFINALATIDTTIS